MTADVNDNESSGSPRPSASVLASLSSSWAARRIFDAILARSRSSGRQVNIRSLPRRLFRVIVLIFYLSSLHGMYQGMVVAMKIGATQYLECSRKTGEGVREVFTYANRAALIDRPKQDPDPFFVTPSRGMKAIQQFFKPAPKSKTAAISSAVAMVELEKFLASSTAPKSLNRFRLLIIGKSGCGKTTILSKVRSIIVCVFRKDPQPTTGMWRKHGEEVTKCSHV
jgi:hypothetical protein